MRFITFYSNYFQDNTSSSIKVVIVTGRGKKSLIKKLKLNYHWYMALLVGRHKPWKKTLMIHTHCGTPFPPQFACQTRLWRRHLRACVLRSVEQDVASLSPAHTHTHTHTHTHDALFDFSVWTTQHAAFLRSHAVELFAAPLIVRCNRNVCSYHLRDFISRVTHARSLPPVKPAFTSSSSLQVPSPFLLYFHFFCLPLSAFLLLAFSIFTWIP